MLWGLHVGMGFAQSGWVPMTFGPPHFYTVEQIQSFATKEKA
jgi:hypothetical protein